MTSSIKNFTLLKEETWRGESVRRISLEATHFLSRDLSEATSLAKPLMNLAWNWNMPRAI